MTLVCITYCRVIAHQNDLILSVFFFIMFVLAGEHSKKAFIFGVGEIIICDGWLGYNI